MLPHSQSFIRRIAAAGTALFVISAASMVPAAEPPPPPIVLDAHVDVLLRLLDAKKGRSLDEQGPAGQVNFANWKQGGVNAVIFAVWIDPRMYPGAKAVERAHEMIDCLEQQAARFPDRLVLCDTAEEVRKAAADGKIAALCGIEGGVAINNDLSLIEKFRQRGVRYMTLTWRGNLKWAGSSQPLTSPWDRVRQSRQGEKEQQTAPDQDDLSSGGLTEMGREVVREMNRVGMVVDLSHVSDQTFFDALAVTSRPVMLSHSNARARSGHPRNISDEMLRALAANKGVIGVNFWADLLEPEGRSRKDEGATSVTVETLLDMIDHIVKVAGVDSVGIGSDFEGMSSLPVGLETAAQMPALFEGLRRRGYSEEEIRKIAGENFLRVLAASETGPAKEEGQ